MNRQLDNLFEKRDCNFSIVKETQKVQENFEQHVVVCNDLNLQIHKIVEERNITEDNIRIDLDEGGGFMEYATPFLILYKRMMNYPGVPND